MVPLMADRRIGVIGDVHAEDKRLEAAINYLRKAGVDSIICTGDIVDGRGDPEACIKTLENNGVRSVQGNHDRWCLHDKARDIPKAHLRSELSLDSLYFLDQLPKQIAIETIAGSLLLCHGIGDNDLRKVWPGTERMPIERSIELDAIIATDNHRFIVNGHMHFKTIIHFESLTLINAGTISGTRWPSFTLIDFETGVIDAYRFQEQEIQQEKTTRINDKPDQVFTNTQDFQGNWHPRLLFHLPAD